MWKAGGPSSDIELGLVAQGGDNCVGIAKTKNRGGVNIMGIGLEQYGIR